MARRQSTGTVAGPSTIAQVTIELLGAAHELANRGERGGWFPNGIDSLTLGVTIAGASVSLSLAGPKASLLAERGQRDLLAFAPAQTETKVMDACRAAAADAPTLGDCNKFVKAVGNTLGVAIEPSANADRIVDIIQTAPWTPLGLGDNVGALQKAGEGALVVAGMKKSEFTDPHTNGHVAVVHGHEVAGHPGFPHASWGSISGNGTFDGSIRDSFPVKDLNKIHYAYLKI